MGGKTFLTALMMTLLLTGCAGKEETRQFEIWRETVAGAEEITFSARITAELEDTAAVYGGRVRATPTQTAVTVTLPETIQGVTFRISGTGRTLEYDGLLLELTPERDDLSPAAAPEVLLRAIREGSVLYTGREGERLTAALEAPGGETVTLWRTQEDIPVYAEIGRDNTTELKLQISEWKIEEQKNGSTNDKDMGGDLAGRPAA